MFDPTIYDNLKVVFEGALYDFDRAGRLHVGGREDLVDLAAMSRSFLMQVSQAGGVCHAQIVLSSGLLDFAGELRRLRLANEVPGCELRIAFRLPGRLAVHVQEFDQYLQDVWGEVAEIVHERTSRLDPLSGQPMVEAEDLDGYQIRLQFRAKIDEDNMEDVEPLLEHLVGTLEFLEHRDQVR